LDGVFVADIGVLGQELAGVRLDPFLLDSGDALVVDVTTGNSGQYLAEFGEYIEGAGAPGAPGRQEMEAWPPGAARDLVRTRKIR